MEKIFAFGAIAWAIIIALVIMSGCGRPIPCTEPAKQISSMTAGMQYSHCYDPKYTWESKR